MQFRLCSSAQLTNLCWSFYIVIVFTWSVTQFFVISAIEYDDFKNTIQSFTLMDSDNVIFSTSTQFAYNMPNLKALKLFNTNGGIPSDLGVTNPGLTMLSISKLKPRVNDDHVTYISSLTQLEELDLG